MEATRQQITLMKAITAEIDSTPPSRPNAFAAKSANQWLKEASGRAQPKSLFMNMWYEGEVCIFFADTNTGKSILAVQIARDISEDQPVLYFDFELSDKQFELRYSVNGYEHYAFPENFIRCEIDSDQVDYEAAGFVNMEDFLSDSMEQLIRTTGAKVLIIDNLTYLKNETEKAKEALPLMKHLKALKKKYGLSILTLAHTPKRDLSQPITINHLGGSKMLMNFCDSSFSMGLSVQDKNIRYLKQIKCRNGQITYDTENVAVFEITKPGNFLGLTPLQSVHGVHGVHTTYEREHLKQVTKEEKQGIINNIISLYNNGMGKSQRAIAAELNISVGMVNKHIQRSCSRSNDEHSEQGEPK